MKIVNYVLTLIVGMGIGWTMTGSRKEKISPSETQVAAAKPIVVIPAVIDKPTPSLPVARPTTKDTHSHLAALNEDFWQAFNDDNLDQARALVEEMGRTAKDGKEYNEGLTRILVRTRDYDQAKPALAHCLEFYPKSRSCLTDMVDVELQIGTRVEQLQAVQKCLASFPEYPQCMNDLAIIRMGEGNFSEAVTIYDKLMDTNGSFGFRFSLEMLHAQLGYALEGAGRTAEAVRHFDIACRSNWSGACAKFQELSSRL